LITLYDYIFFVIMFVIPVALPMAMNCHFALDEIRRNPPREPSGQQ
jgi:hypothetical protein